MARLCPLFSGSSGNSIYVGSGGNGVLIDIGRSAKQIEKAIKRSEIDLNTIKAIFITHEHSDHIQGLKVFASRYGIDVYASKGTLEALKSKGLLSEKFRSRIIPDEGIYISDIFVKSFETSHDSKDSVGYTIVTGDGRTTTIATDIGFISEKVRDAVVGCDFLFIESNHDVNMLKNGPYPYYLKRRILSDIGHLSNEACAKELPVFAKKGTTRFMLGHLSGENNVPELAYQTALSSFMTEGLIEGIDFELSVAPKENVNGKSVVF